MAQELFQYVKGKGRFKNQNVGMLMATFYVDEIHIVSCKANVVAGDVFNKKLARKILEERMQKIKDYGFVSVIPKSFKDDIDRMEDRCMRYFKSITFHEILYK